MRASGYLFVLFAFNTVGLVYLYILLRPQEWLPLNPQGFDNLASASLRSRRTRPSAS